MFAIRPHTYLPKVFYIGEQAIYTGGEMSPLERVDCLAVHPKARLP